MSAVIIFHCDCFSFDETFSVLKCWRPPAEDKGVTPTFALMVSWLVGRWTPPVSVEKIPKRICRYQVTAHTTSVVQVPVEGNLPV